MFPQQTWRTGSGKGGTDAKFPLLIIYMKAGLAREKPGGPFSSFLPLPLFPLSIL